MKLLGDYGGVLSLIEIGAGSLIHGMGLPLGGHLLSLNQGYLLSRLTLKSKDPTLVLGVSNIAAVLKSFSPAGKKFGPMLSLSMQGLLFRLGLLLGSNLFGILLGMILLSLWAFIQPLVTYYIFFGEVLLDAAKFLFDRLTPYLPVREEALIPIFIGIVLVKILLALIIGVLAYKKRNQEMVLKERAQGMKKSPAGNPLFMAMRDIFRPLFLFSLVLTATFLYFSQHPWTQILWYLLRPVGIGFIFFYFSRTLTLDRIIVRLKGGRFETFAKGLEIALAKVRKVI